MLPRDGEPRLPERRELWQDLLDRFADRESQGGRGLVVTAARRVQASRGLPDPAEKLPLDPRVDVLVIAVDFEAPFLDLGQQKGESRKDRTRVVR